jgi:hypothetical protein
MGTSVARGEDKKYNKTLVGISAEKYVLGTWALQCPRKIEQLSMRTSGIATSTELICKNAY